MIKSYKFRRHLSNAIIYLILGVMCLIWIAPFVYLVLHSLRADGGVLTNDALLPKQLTFQHYIDLFTGRAPAESLAELPEMVPQHLRSCLLQLRHFHHLRIGGKLHLQPSAFRRP